MAKTKKKVIRKRATKKRPVKRKSKPAEKIVLREKIPDYMIQVNDPRSLRKELLETLREIIIFMQSYEKFKRIQEEKVIVFNQLKADVRDLNGLIDNKLRSRFPKGKLMAIKSASEAVEQDTEEEPIQEAPRAPTVPVAPTPIAEPEEQRAPSELDELEGQLKDIESQLRNIN
jgi:hypothetical protein